MIAKGLKEKVAFGLTGKIRKTTTLLPLMCSKRWLDLLPGTFERTVEVNRHLQLGVRGTV